MNFSAAVMIMIIAIIGCVSFLMITNEFMTSNNNAGVDPVNNTGILGNNTEAGGMVGNMSAMASNNIAVPILLGIILIFVVLFGAVYTLSKR